MERGFMLVTIRVKEKPMKARLLSISAAAVLMMAAAQANAEEGMDLAKKAGCLACHAVDKKSLAPAGVTSPKNTRATPVPRLLWLKK